MYEQSHRDYLRSGYLHHRPPGSRGLLIITVTTPLPTKPSVSQNARELKLAWTRQLLTCRCVSVMLLRSMQHTKELADAKAEKRYALRDDAVSDCRRLHIKATVSQCVKPTTASGVDNAASDWQTPANGIISPQREADHAKQFWKEPRSILMSSADRVAHIDGQFMHRYCEQYTIQLSSVRQCSVIKTEQSIYECLLGFCFNNIFCAATNFGCIDSFLRPIPETKKWWWWFPLVLLLPACF